LFSSDDVDVVLLALVAGERRRREEERRRRRLRRRQLAVLALLLTTTAVVAVLAAAVAAPSVVASRCSLTDLRPVSLGSNTIVRAADGSLLGSIPSARNRQQLPLAKISPWIAKATVAIEDRRFWRHGALDYIGIARAAVADLGSGRPVQGGSTLTQQLARNLYIGQPRNTLSRKLEEACLAIRLARQMSKRQILADYLNVVFYGHRAYGIEAAAQTYFARSASRLSASEAALLAGLPQAPSLYDPLRKPWLARARRNEVLLAMLRAGYLTPPAYHRALHQRLDIRRGSLYTKIQQPYFFGYVEKQLAARYGVIRVEQGGLQVRTTIDPRLQHLAQHAMASILRRRTDPASALVAIDPRTGNVRTMAAYIPSRQRLQFNLAVQSGRQAGSAFKPFTLAAALEHGDRLSSTYKGPPELLIRDPRCWSRINEPWLVHNNADESAGTMNLIDATANSVNTIFAQLVTQVGPESVVRMAHRLGIRSRLLPVCSITLGTQPVDPLEMTSAYATFADHGIRHTPQAISAVVAPSGEANRTPAPAAHRAVSARIADEVTRALEAVTKKGTGTAAAIGRPIAGKTGTAERFVDAWFCGYVPQLATCVWVGYPHREVPMNDVEGYAPVYGGTIPARIWHDFMRRALANEPVTRFGR
jgi:penicillin-binding protein 1A